MIAIDTGYLFSETHEHMENLKKLFPNIDVRTFSSSMSIEEMEKRHGEKLWEQGEEGQKLYQRIRKIEPMKLALEKLRPKALFAGLRAEQNEFRSKLSHIEMGIDGIYRIHPILDMRQAEVNLYFEHHNLLYHPLAKKGYDSIGDTHSTKPGHGRSGRFLGSKSECGLNTQIIEQPRQKDFKV